MKRREFITLIGGMAVARPLAAGAQQAGAVPTVGVLMDVAENGAESPARIAAFRQGLAALGWKDGDNIHLELRWAASNRELITKFAGELVGLAPRVILANGTPAVVALKKATGAIPVICAPVQDPVGLGLVQSLSRPGGNITGFTFVNPELIGKWVSLLKEVTPGVTRMGLMFNPSTTPFFFNFVRELQDGHQTSGVELAAMPVKTPDDIETVIKALGAPPRGSLIVPPDPFNIDHIRQIADLAGKNQVTAISVYRPFVLEGGLLAYGPYIPDILRRSAEYVDRILKGANPADLPVQQPTDFKLAVNLKAARTLGLTMPPALLATADDVIE
jgi:putative ABC transport system substrate-binding protein